MNRTGPQSECKEVLFQAVKEQWCGGEAAEARLPCKQRFKDHFYKRAKERGGRWKYPEQSFGSTKTVYRRLCGAVPEYPSDLVQARMLLLNLSKDKTQKRKPR